MAELARRAHTTRAQFREAAVAIHVTEAGWFKFFTQSCEGNPAQLYARLFNQ
jgi:hypothetical protein